MNSRSIVPVLVFAAFSSGVMADPVISRDDINRRNTQINRYCTRIVQIKHDYDKLKGAELLSRNRVHSTEIEACYRAHALAVSQSATPGS